jgi:hypothetical protein
MTDLSKFDELRIKTEEQLLLLINNELDLGVRDARLALRSTDSWAVVAEGYRRAKRAYAEASRWIHLVAEIPEYERGSWEARLKHLREMLEGLSVLASAPTEDKIPTLARALWKARDCPEGSPEEDWFRAERALKSQSVCSGS